MLLLPGESTKYSSKTSLNKEDGTLYFTNKRLAWCKGDEQTPAVEVLHENFSAQQVSKGGKKVMLKISAAAAGATANPPPMVSYVFVWRWKDKDAAVAERGKFVTDLSFLSLKRAKNTSSGQQTPNAGAQAGPSGDRSSTTTTNTAAAGNSEYKNVKIGAVPASAEEVKLRQEVLSKNADLTRVHKSLVISGLVSEDEFWSTRKHILETYAIQSQLRKGESSTWLDLTPTTHETGNFKYTITPSVARRIFKEYPQVKRAYVDNVPHKLTEKLFWKRFVASQFFNRGRSAEAFKGRDNIFDKCSLEEDATFSNTNRFDLEYLTRLLDLTRSEEDAVETGNAPDFTMRPSLVDSKLPLIRRFNHHSQLVLQSVLNSKRKEVTSDHKSADKALEEATVLDDLEISPTEKKIRLDIQDRSRYFASLSEEKKDKDGRQLEADVTTDPEEIRALLKIDFDISRPLDRCGNTQKTMATMSNAAHRLTMQTRPNRIQELRIPDDVTVAVAECHGAGTEMLRHLWTLIRLPPTPERQQRAEKIVAAFENVNQHIRETIVRANAAESKNTKLGVMVEKMLQPISDSLRTGRQAFESRAKALSA
ncbi:RNA polymerase II transcription factor B subunit 1 [Coemansia sp. RSA 1365]|nr:RNA polymerase II transcription factor B subunit 1 [Coemansia sp. RSA 1365]